MKEEMEKREQYEKPVMEVEEVKDDILLTSGGCVSVYACPAAYGG